MRQEPVEVVSVEVVQRAAGRPEKGSGHRGVQTRRFLPKSRLRRSTTMAEGHRMTTADVLAKVMAGEHGDFVREAVALVARELIEAAISVEVGAGLGEVSAERTAHRNGYRPRPWETRVGEI